MHYSTITIDKRKAKKEDFEIGLKAYLPANTGGVLNCVCVSVDSKKAEFKSLNKDFPGNFFVHLHDITQDEESELSEDFVKLYAALNNPKTLWFNDKKLNDTAIKAERFGLLSRLSITQAHLTPKGSQIIKKYYEEQRNHA